MNKLIISVRELTIYWLLSKLTYRIPESPVNPYNNTVVKSAP